ncbi:hypothetical protein TRFO_24942 [Tritrichomonas foetus]|uniref:DnaK protein n=1 Tax=Tritrichomonas foetus TaxID=1144522 RepID=A0A1J4KB44_9EUKA|nr:hypothetical protein TRFO_24942 [Tritrichomonas foetus]|eukprot:OHT06910.1 hypothetical protein TRFO_24942 [Tritrichomonas foetus]
MFFFSFISFIFSASIIGIDLGSQYLKLAEATLSGFPKPFHVNGMKSTIPSAAAFKPTEKAPPFSKDDFNDIELTIGQQALKLLIKNESLGYRFLPFAVSRENYTNGCIADPKQTLALYLYNLLRSSEISVGVAIAVPAYWTNPQRVAVVQACQMINFPLINMMTDATAVAALFSSTRSGFFKNEAYKVLFVDIGATKVECYGLAFKWVDDKTDVLQTTVTYSEKAGGHFMTKLVAQAKNVSLKKAEKILNLMTSEELREIIKPQIDIIERVIFDCYNKSKSIFKTLNESPSFDEVQMLGFLSQKPLFSEIVKKVTNIQLVKHDLNPTEAISYGSVYATSVSYGLSPYPPGIVTQVPFVSMNVTCGDTSIYCVKDEMRCNSEIMEIGTEACQIVTITADPKDIPEGSSPIMAQYRLKNLTNLHFDKDSKGLGRFTMNNPYPAIRKIEWCSGLDCQPIDFEPYFANIAHLNESVRFISNYQDADSIRFEKSNLLGKIALLLDSIDLQINGQNEIFVELTNDFLKNYKEAKELHESGQLRNKSNEELKDLLNTINEIAKSLGIKPE